MKYTQPTSAADECNQRISDSNSDAPGPPPVPPEPQKPPGDITHRLNVPPGAELEGEDSTCKNVSGMLTIAETDVLPAVSGDEDPRDGPKELQVKSEHVHERVERAVEEHSPQQTQDKPSDPGREVDASRGSEGDEDPHNRPKKPIGTPEGVSKRVERAGEEDSP